MKYIQNLMTNVFIINCPQGSKDDKPVLGQGQIIFEPGETKGIENDMFENICGEDSVVGRFIESGRLKVVNKDQQPVQPTVESNSDAVPDKFPHLMDSGDAETEDGKVKHEVKSVETVQAPQANMPTGRKRGAA